MEKFFTGCCLVDQEVKSKSTIGDLIKQLGGKFDENIQIDGFHRYEI